MALKKEQIKELMDILSPYVGKMWLIDPNDMTEAEIQETMREMEEYKEKKRLRDLGINTDEEEK